MGSAPQKRARGAFVLLFFFFFGGLLFVLESSLSLFIWLGRISILLPFTSIKTACQVTGFDDGVTFSACRKPIHFLVFGGGGSAKLLLMKNKASNATGDITVNQKITVVLWVSFFLTMQNDIRMQLSLTPSYLHV